MIKEAHIPNVMIYTSWNIYIYIYIYIKYSNKDISIIEK